MRMQRTAGLYAAIFLPPAVFVVAGASSLAAGAMLACVVAIATGLNPTLRLIFRPRGVPIALIACLALVGLHSLMASMNGPFNSQRAVASLALLCFYFIGAHSIAISFFRLGAADLDRVCRQLFYLLVLLALAALLGFHPVADPDRKLIFPFAEPSHFALAFTPFLLYVCLREQGFRRFALIMGGFLLGYWVQNLTLIVGCLLTAGLSLRTRGLPLLLGLVAVLAAVADVSYFASRVDLTGDVDNLSTLSYLQGWELVEEALRNSTWWGIGFQQLGEQPTSVPIAALIYLKGGLEMNLADGSFVLAKVLAEFGIVGIALSGLLLVFFVRTAVALRGLTGQNVALMPNQVFAQCVVVSFSVDFFIRGAGYFTGTSLLFLAATMFLLRKHRTSKRQQEQRWENPKTHGA